MVENKTDVLRKYVARAVSTGHPIGFRAEFGFPGGVVAFVLEGDAPEIYLSAEDAENEARRVLVESLNARHHFTSRNSISRKLTGDEFAHELGLTDIYPGEWATMWGTKQDRVMQQIEGVAEVPFAARWILPVLRSFPAALAMAQKIVEENTTMKPEWLERKRQAAENEEAGR